MTISVNCNPVSHIVTSLVFFFLSPYYSVADGVKHIWVQNLSLPLSICDPEMLFILLLYIVLVIVQSLSHVRPFETPWTAVCQASVSITISLNLLNSCPLSQWYHPIISSSVTPPPLAFSFSYQSLSQWVSSSHQKAKVSELQFQHQSFSEYSGLISFRVDWFDLLAVQGTLKSLPHQHSSKESILWCSVFFTVQLSHSYMTIGNTIALTIQTFLFLQRDVSDF